jgi:hypothetical protein
MSQIDLKLIAPSSQEILRRKAAREAAGEKIPENEGEEEGEEEDEDFDITDEEAGKKHVKDE